MKIAVLGGGIAGLWAARMLHQSYDITVFEALPQAGGLCRTKKSGGRFLFDVGGGHIFHSVYPDILQSILSTIGEDRCLKHIRNTRIYMYDRFIKYPFENGLGDLPDKARFECVMGYINAYFNRGEPESFNTFLDFINRRFGEGIAQHFMIPYNRKIWCVDPSHMSADWIANRVPQAPLEDVVKAALGIQTEGYTHQSTFFYPAHGGIQSFIDAVAEPFNHVIRLNTPVQSIARYDRKWIINDESFDRVISTIPLDRFCALCRDIPEQVRRRSEALRHISLLSVLIVLKNTSQPPYSWIYLPHENQSEANRLTYFSNYSPNLNPDGYTSLLAEATLLPETCSEISEERINALITNLSDMGLLNCSEVEHIDWEVTPYAYLMHDHRMSENRDYIIHALSDESLMFAGRFGSYSYYNIDQVIRQVNTIIESRFSL